MERLEEVVVHLNSCGSIIWLGGKDCYVFSIGKLQSDDAIFITLVALNMMINRSPRIPSLAMEG